ncbi:MAG: hypothetical protein ACXACI_12625 [Candidatus Hodarchaeales archaeon]
MAAGTAPVQETLETHGSGARTGKLTSRLIARTAYRLLSSLS